MANYYESVDQINKSAELVTNMFNEIKENDQELFKEIVGMLEQSENKCTEEQFTKDVENHSMKIMSERGINRHLRFSTKGSFVHYFDLTTWADRLCISGDMGTYVFRRCDDMFRFFRMGDWVKDDKLHINADYWGEKLESICKTGKYEEYDENTFRESVKYYFDSYMEDNSENDGDELWEEIESKVLSYSCEEHRAYEAVSEFEWKDFQFTDFFDGGGTVEFTYHYIWCLYAIVWGIQQYDLEKAKESYERNRPLETT